MVEIGGAGRHGVDNHYFWNWFYMESMNEMFLYQCDFVCFSLIYLACLSGMPTSEEAKNQLKDLVQAYHIPKQWKLGWK